MVPLLAPSLTSALLPWVAPVVLLAVGASLAPKAWPAGALPCELTDMAWPRLALLQHTFSPILSPQPLSLSCLTWLQVGVRECWGWQAQGWQPCPLARFQKLGLQRSQLWPSTWGRQWHCPLCLSQWHCCGPQVLASVPRGLQEQPGTKRH